MVYKTVMTFAECLNDEIIIKDSFILFLNVYLLFKMRNLSEIVRYRNCRS